MADHGRGKCSTHLKQLQRAGVMTPIAEKVSQKEHLLNLLDRWAEADSDEEHDTAERAVLAQAKALGKSSLSAEDVADIVKRVHAEATRRGIATAKAKGARGPGRPKKIDPEEFRRLELLIDNNRALALVLRVHPATIYRIRKNLLFAKKLRAGRNATRPRSGGASP